MMVKMVVNYDDNDKDDGEDGEKVG